MLVIIGEHCRVGHNRSNGSAWQVHGSTSKTANQGGKPWKPWTNDSCRASSSNEDTSANKVSSPAFGSNKLTTTRQRILKLGRMLFPLDVMVAPCMVWVDFCIHCPFLALPNTLWCVHSTMSRQRPLDWQCAVELVVEDSWEDCPAVQQEHQTVCQVVYHIMRDTLMCCVFCC